MHIRVLGSNMEVGQALREHVESHLSHHVEKYFKNAISADVHFSKEKDLFKVGIIINEGVKNRAVNAKGDATADDPYACFNDATQKAVKQLRRYKRKITNHHSGTDDEQSG